MRVGDSYYVEDLNSKNGTWVQGMALEEGEPMMQIKHGDRIKIGDIFLRFAFARET